MYKRNRFNSFTFLYVIVTIKILIKEKSRNMNFLKIIIGVLLYTVFLTAETITLQEGVNGYSGCEDSYIESMSADGYNGSSTTHGEQSFFAAGHLSYKVSWGSCNYTARAVVQFNLSNVPELDNASITSAKLELYAEGNHSSNWAAGEKDLQGGTKKIHEAENSWSESTITWSGYGYALGWGWYQSIGTFVDESSNSSFQTWESFDVTNVVQKHLSNPSTNNGFMIRMDDWATVNYSSSENSNTSLRPKLVITYEGGNTTESKFINVSSVAKSLTLTLRNKLKISLPEAENIKLSIFELNGQKIVEKNIRLNAGVSYVDLEKDCLTLKQYVVKMESKSGVLSRRVLLK